MNKPMTIARKRQVHPETTPYYHVVSRCVRRAFLCGTDGDRCFEHRRQWIVERLNLLAQVFAIDVVAYAVMSNHVHLVVRLAPQRSAAWSDDEVIKRWSAVYGIPALVHASQDTDAPAAVKDAAGDMIAVRRQRLGSLSWFMKCLNESIARRANREDGCTGAFWEGRFKSQALLDEKALLACMAYVDLNPIRAGTARTPEHSDYTSVRQRIRGTDEVSLVGFSGESEKDPLPISLPDYLSLVEWTGRISVPGKRSRIPEGTPPILERLGFDDRAWVESLKLFRNTELRALGPTHRMRELAQALSRRWFRGKGECQAVFGS